MNALVVAIHRSDKHSFSKTSVTSAQVIKNHGIEGDAHAGFTVKHRSRVKLNPDAPNLRQIHLIQGELLQTLGASGFNVPPGALGENITTAGIDLLDLSESTLLRIGGTVVLRVTGLRNPCGQIEHFQAGLLKAVLDKDAAGNLIRKAGIMAVVVAGGLIETGDAIIVEAPVTHVPLQMV